MNANRFTRPQILAILKEAERIGNMATVCRRHNISRKTLYRWQRTYGGTNAFEARRLHQLELEEEGVWLKRMLVQRYVSGRSQRGSDR